MGLCVRLLQVLLVWVRPQCCGSESCPDFGLTGIARHTQYFIKGDHVLSTLAELTGLTCRHCYETGKV
jgi:hypothetical protein